MERVTQQYIETTVKGNGSAYKFSSRLLHENSPSVELKALIKRLENISGDETKVKALKKIQERVDKIIRNINTSYEETKDKDDKKPYIQAKETKDRPKADKENPAPQADQRKKITEEQKRLYETLMRELETEDKYKECNTLN
jgi:hypothetical protein